MTSRGSHGMSHVTGSFFHDPCVRLQYLIDIVCKCDIVEVFANIPSNKIYCISSFVGYDLGYPEYDLGS